MAPNLLRSREGTKGTTNIELFFDLVYVFATTQLSHRLLAHPSATGALRAALLMVWIYTTWVTNWLDPERLPVRLALLTLALASLVMSAALPNAFGDRGLVVGCTYAATQIGRTIFTLTALGDDPLVRNFQRILVWCVLSGALAVLGGIVHGHGRELCWVATVAVDLGGGAAGFWTPGLGRSTTADWTIEGGHIANRCQAFLLIALGEGIVVIGASFSAIANPTASSVIVLVLAFAGSALLWWIYFDRSADEGARIIARSDDPGRLGRSAYHFIHPVMVAGIIVTAAADERVVVHPGMPVDAVTAWLVLGGTGLYLLGHALFKATVWHRIPWSRLAAIALLTIVGLVATHLEGVVLGAATNVILLAVVVSDRLLRIGPEPERAG